MISKSPNAQDAVETLCDFKLLLLQCRAWSSNQSRRFLLVRCTANEMKATVSLTHRACLGQLLTGSQTLLDHFHYRCDVLECSRMRFAVQVAQIENHNAFSSELGFIRFLLGINVS